ncbi:MAG TPA: hypothetical protein VMB91_05190 [Solirubrobacteraceae bacterium]|nr:hypothetical protein [Solirubrobacteraceae bacterium]
MNEPRQPRPPERPPVPPPPGTRPTEALGYGDEPPPRGPWWQQGWGLALIALVALLVGLGAGLAIGKGTNETITTTSSSPGTVTHTTTSTVQHTQTVTSTHTVTVSKEGSGEGGEGGGGGETQSFNGTGSKNLGTVKVSAPSTVRWTSEGASFAVTSSRGEVLSSEGHKGTASLAAGSYEDLEVQTDSGWTLKITPAG